MNIKYSKIVDYIIKTVQENSSGFQYIINYLQIEEFFNIKLDDSIINQIEKELLQRKEVADIECYNNTFDVVLYTDYAPNYDL